MRAATHRGLVFAAWLALGVVVHAASARAQSATAQAASAPPKAAPARQKADAKNPKAEPKPEPEEPQRITDATAYTLDGGHLRIGLFKIEYGIFDFLSVGTYTAPWGLLAPTVIGKLRIFKADPIALAVQTGFAYFDSSRLRLFDSSPGNAVVTVFPLEAFLSYRFGEAFTMSVGAAYTEVAIHGALTLDFYGGAGKGVADNAQLMANAEFHLSRGVALIVFGRWLMLQRVSGNANATLHPDAFTTVIVNGNLGASSFQVRDAFSVLPSVLFTWGVFNLRLGLGFGNYDVPLVNFVLPRRTLIPDFDLYFVL